MSDAQPEDDRIERIAEEITERFQRGENPCAEEYVNRYPDLRDRILRLHRAIKAMERCEPPGELTHAGTPPPQLLVERIGDFRVLREIGRGGMGIVYEAEQISLRRRVALKVLPQHSSNDERRLKRFEIEARSAAALHHTNITPIFAVGHADGYPFYAMQFIDGPGLDSVIREVRRIRADSDERYRMVDNEATIERASPADSLNDQSSDSDPVRAIANSMLGRGEGSTTTRPDGGRREAEWSNAESYTQTQSKEGTTADESGQSVGVKDSSRSDWRLFGSRFDASSAVSTSKAQTYWHNVARIGVQVAEALQHAHARGVLHRDIKPSNLMVDSTGMVWVTDFGLAKAVDQDELTQTGEMVGTLRYLSPEQFSGKADARSDVFSLGLTLYELSTLRPAYAGSGQSELIEQVMRVEITPPRKSEPTIPRDLETIILKSIHDAPGQRYETAGHLAADLIRYLKDEPIRARRESWREKTRRWRRRNPSLARALLGIAAITLIALTSITALWLHAESEKFRAEQAETNQKRLAVQNLKLADSEAQARGLAEQQLYIARMNLVERAFERNDWIAARELLDAYADSSDRHDFVGIEWRLWNRKLRQLISSVQDHRPVFSMTLTPDEQGLLSVGMDGSIQFWDLGSNELIDSWEAHDNWISQVEILPGGLTLATSSYDATIKIWNVESHELIRIIETPSPVRCFLVDQENGQLLSGHASGQLVRWRIEDGSELQSIDAHKDDIYCVAQSPDGQYFATGGQDGLIHIWDRDLERVQVCDGHEDTARTLVFGTQSTTLYSAGDDSKIWIWDAIEGSGREVGQHEEMIYDLKLVDQGRQLVSCSRDETIRLWQIAPDALSLERVLKGHIYTVYQLALSRDGSRLFSCGHDKTVKQWSLSRLSEVDQVRVFEDTEQNTMSLETVSILPDGSQIATAGTDRFVYVYSRDGRLLRQLECDLDPINCVQLCPDGQSILAGDDYGNLWVFEASHEWERRRLAHWNEAILAIEYAPDSRRVAIARKHGGVTIIDSEDGTIICEFNDLPSDAFAVAWSPTGKRLAGAGDDEAILVWDLELGEVVHELRDHRYRVYALRFDPNRDELYSGGRDGFLRRWDMQTGELLSSRLAHGNSIHAILLTADDKSVLTAGTDRLVRIWDRPTGQIKNTLSAHEYGVLDAALDADDQILVSVSADDTLHFWRAEPAPRLSDQGE